jgi:hypothetical protein
LLRRYTLASAPADRRRLIAEAALPALRHAASEKGVAKVASYLAVRRCRMKR